MLDQILGLLAGRGRGARTGAPPLPPARVVVLPDEDDDIAAAAALSTGCGEAAFITYRDARGQVSERRISIVSVRETSGGDRLLQAYCHEREARRSFRIDRIAEIVDLGTGEIFEGAAIAQALGRYVEGDRDMVSEALFRCRHGIVILAFLAHCDGRYHPAEEDVILGYILDVCFDLAVNGDVLLARVRGLYPDKAQYFDAIEAFRMEASARDAARLARAAVQLIEADGAISAQEYNFVQALQGELME